MKIKNSILKLFTVMGLFFIQPANAEDNTSYSELDALRSQNAILTEQLKNAELKNKIGTAIPLNKNTKLKPSNIDRYARVQMVAGIAGKLKATIKFSDGGETVAWVGKQIANLGIVKSITTDEVIVSNGRETYSVPFSSEPTTGSSSQYSIPQLAPIVPAISTPIGLTAQ